jgi:hypothetical protein
MVEELLLERRRAGRRASPVELCQLNALVETGQKQTLEALADNAGVSISAITRIILDKGLAEVAR